MYHVLDVAVYSVQMNNNAWFADSVKRMYTIFVSFTFLWNKLDSQIQRYEYVNQKLIKSITSSSVSIPFDDIVPN